MAGKRHKRVMPKKQPKPSGRPMTDAERYEATKRIRIQGIFLEEELVKRLDAAVAAESSSRTEIIRDALEKRLKRSK